MSDILNIFDKNKIFFILVSVFIFLLVMLSEPVTLSYIKKVEVIIFE